MREHLDGCRHTLYFEDGGLISLSALGQKRTDWQAIKKIAVQLIQPVV